MNPEKRRKTEMKIKGKTGFVGQAESREIKMVMEAVLVRKLT